MGMRASVNLVPGTARRAKLTCQQTAKSEVDGIRASAKSASQLACDRVAKSGLEGRRANAKSDDAKSDQAKSRREER